jgi:hypothetical protein
MSRRFLLPVLATVLGSLLALVALAPRTAPADEVSATTKAKVKQLVTLLDDADAARRAAAAKALVSLGSDILPVLTDPDQKLSARQTEAVADIVKKIRALQGDGEPTASKVTLLGTFTLEKALAQIAKQTGNVVEDRRTNKSEEKRSIDLNNVPFWQAIDQLARDTDSRLDLYQKDGVLALVDGPYHEQTASINGIFRTVAKEISAHKNLDADMGYYQVSLEVTWEPRFRPFFIETRPDSLVVKDDKGKDLAGAQQPGGGRMAVDQGHYALVDLRLPPAQRSVNHLGLLKGKLAVLGPSKWQTFTFDDLKVSEQTKDGVTAKLSKTNLTPDLWTLEMTLKYPESGPSFESFESWLVYNEIYLVKKDDPQQRFANNGGYETGNSSGTKASISYHFVDDPKTKFNRGKPDEWKVVYKAPGQFIEVPATFEFKDVPLP